MLLARARSALARAARAPFLLPELVPPVEFASRIEPLPPGCSTIDNEVYEQPDVAATWHDEDALSQLATLRLLNGARIPYFDRIWRQQLHLTPDRHGQFLEVGCGGGIATGALAKLGYHMSGIDASPAAIAAARAHCDELHVQERTSFATGSAYDLSAYPDGSFDGVLMADVLEHLLDLPAALREAHRVLRPGGVFVFDTINRTYKSYVATIVLAQQVFGLVPPNTHDWRLYVKPHEISFVLQSHGFLCDTRQFRGMRPSFGALPNAMLMRSLPARLASIKPPSIKMPTPQPAQFVETSSLEVNYLGWARKASCSNRKGSTHEE